MTPNPLADIVSERLKQLGVENPIVNFKEPFLGLGGWTEYVEASNGEKKGDFRLYLPHIGQYQGVLNIHQLCWDILKEIG